MFVLSPYFLKKKCGEAGITSFDIIEHCPGFISTGETGIYL
jgi:hypothetical protein